MTSTNISRSVFVTSWWTCTERSTCCISSRCLQRSTGRRSRTQRSTLRLEREGSCWLPANLISNLVRTRINVQASEVVCCSMLSHKVASGSCFEDDQMGSCSLSSTGAVLCTTCIKSIEPFFFFCYLRGGSMLHDELGVATLVCRMKPPIYSIRPLWSHKSKSDKYLVHMCMCICKHCQFHFTWKLWKKILCMKFACSFILGPGSVA